HQRRHKTFKLSDSNQLSLLLTQSSIEAIPINGNLTGDNKLWRVMQELFVIQDRSFTTLTFSKVPKPASKGTQMKISVTGDFLRKLKQKLQEDESLKLKLTMENTEMRKTYHFDIKIESHSDSITFFTDEKWDREDMTYFRIFITMHGLKITLELTLKKKMRNRSSDPTIIMGRKALEEQILCDFELIAENGTKFPCHKVFLASHSPVFSRMIQINCRESTENSCHVQGVPEEGVKAFLKYVYYGDVEDANGSQRIAFGMMEMGHRYDIGSLERAMKDILLRLPTASFDASVALWMFSFAMKVEGCEDLKEKAIEVIKLKPKEVMGCGVIDLILEKDKVTAKELLSVSLHSGSANGPSYHRLK
ncbi:Kelch repeat and BTB domain-containing protein 12, partial [Orchesella cincta]